MKTPLLDSVKCAYITDVPEKPMGFNSGLVYFPRDAGTQTVEMEEPEPPQTIQDTEKARGISNKKAPRGPQATSMTASRDNVANYQPKGIS